MTLTNTFLLFLAMTIVAVTPGPGVLVVVSRSLTGGFRHGVITSIGIVFGDYIFILLAVYGLIAIAETMGQLFIIIKYLGAAYLIFLGIQLLRAKPQTQTTQKTDKVSYLTDYFAGLITTLGNPKAILFYLSFFPAFLDLSSMTSLDVGIILLTATIAIGGVMLAYAYLATKATSRFQSSRFGKVVTFSAGGVLIGSGTLMALKQ